MIDFKQAVGNWIKEGNFKNLMFKFQNVSYEFYEVGDPNAMIEDRITISEITFFPSSSRETNDCIMTQSKPKDKDDFIFFFQDGKVIRICCEKIELLVEK